MRKPNKTVCRKQDIEEKDYDASTITLTTRMTSTVKVTVQAKLHCNNETVTTGQCYKIIEDLQHDTTIILHGP